MGSPVGSLVVTILLYTLPSPARLQSSLIAIEVLGSCGFKRDAAFKLSDVLSARASARTP